MAIHRAANRAVRPIEDVLLGPTQIDEMFSDNQQDAIALAVAEALQIVGVDTVADALTIICAEWREARRLRSDFRELIHAVENHAPRVRTAEAICRVEAFIEG